MNLGRFALVPLISGLLAVSGAIAQETNPQENPTARQRAGVGPTDPVSLETLSGLLLEQRGITSLEGIAVATPAITLTPSLNSSNTPILYMRGQGLDNPSQIARDGAVGVYEDGFYIARSQALTFDLLDLDRVEVLRGPQGALYGRDTTGGVVNLISTAPAGELRFKQTADFGNRNMFRALASLDTPEWHGVSAKMTAIASSIDGYVHNPLPNSHDYGAESQRAGRLQLRWDPVSNLHAGYFLEQSDLDSTPAYDTNPYLNGQFIYSFFFPYYANPSGPTTTTYRPIFLPLSTSTHVAQGLTLGWDASSAFAVKSLTGYRTLHADAAQDYAEFIGIPEETDDGYRHYQLSQELQFTGDLFGKQISYSGGASYFKERGRHDRFYAFASLGRDIEQVVLAKTRSTAAYLQLQWRPGYFRGRLELAAAGRYTEDVKDAERFVTDSAVGQEENGASSGAVNHLSYRRTNPAGTLSYRWTDGLTTYATASTGYRSGGALETAPVGHFDTNTFQPESLVTYELGLRSTFLGDHLQVNVAAFSSRERDIQYAIPVTAVTDQVYPLQKATIRGVDLEWVVAPLRDLAVSADVEFLHWTIDQAVVLAGTPLDPATGSGSPYSVGQSITKLLVLPYAPKYNLTAASDYTFLRWYSGEASAHLDFTYRGQSYSDFAAGPDVPGRQFDTRPAVGLLNARIVFAGATDWSHRVKLGLWGRNVLNRKYYVLAGGFGSGISQFMTPASGAAVPVGWVARAGAWAEGATYGIFVSYEY